jgi:hypothetical protein
MTRRKMLKVTLRSALGETLEVFTHAGSNREIMHRLPGYHQCLRSGGWRIVGRTDA